MEGLPYAQWEGKCLRKAFLRQKEKAGRYQAGYNMRQRAVGRAAGRRGQLDAGAFLDGYVFGRMQTYRTGSAWLALGTNGQSHRGF